MRTIYALTILTTLALGTTALAEPTANGSRGWLDRLDANEDGKVTQAEMKSEASQRFEELDADNNGRIAKEELAAHHERMRAARGRDAKRADKPHGERCRGKMGDRLIEKLDANGDGTVDAKELDGQVEQKFARMDANGDHVLDATELERDHGKRGRKHHKHGADAAGNAATPH